MKKFYLSLAVLLCAAISTTVNAQWITHDSTLTSSGSYSSLGWPSGVTITIPAGENITVTMGSPGGNLIVNGNLTSTNGFWFNGSALTVANGAQLTLNGDFGDQTTTNFQIGTGAQINVTGAFTPQSGLVVSKGAQLTANSFTINHSLVIDTNAQVTVSGDFSTNASGGDSLIFRSGSVCNITGTANVNTGYMHIQSGAVINSGTFNFQNPNNIIDGTINNSGTLTFKNGPNTMDCPGEIITQDLHNESSPDPLTGSGYVQINNSFTGNQLTNSPGITVNYKDNSPGGTQGTQSPCTTSTGLPVSVKYFNVSVSDGHVILDWITGSEQNNSGFSVENSTDGIHFNQVSFVNTKAVNGNSSSNLTYEYTDDNPLAGTSYYRIQQKNTDGSVSYTSDIVRVETDKAGSVVLYPNPAASTLYISGNITPGAGYRVININGQTVAKSATTSIDVSKLPAGIYIVQEVTGKQLKTIGKFIKR